MAFLKKLLATSLVAFQQKEPPFRQEWVADLTAFKSIPFEVFQLQLLSYC